jgi:hypothetical protein
MLTYGCHARMLTWLVLWRLTCVGLSIIRPWDPCTVLFWTVTLTEALRCYHVNRSFNAIQGKLSCSNYRPIDTFILTGMYVGLQTLSTLMTAYCSWHTDNMLRRYAHWSSCFIRMLFCCYSCWWHRRRETVLFPRECSRPSSAPAPASGSGGRNWEYPCTVQRWVASSGHGSKHVCRCHWGRGNGRERTAD